MITVLKCETAKYSKNILFLAIKVNPLVLFGHFWPKNFLFWIFKNHSFIVMLRNLMTFMALGMWTHKKNLRSWS